MALRSCCSVSVRAPAEPSWGGGGGRDRLPSRAGAYTLPLRQPSRRDLTTGGSHRWSRPSGDLRRWDLGSSWLWWHSQEPSPGPTCRRGLRGHISRAHRRRRSGRAPAGLARRARRSGPWCFTAESLWGGIVEERGCPGNYFRGARTAASGPGCEPSVSRSRWDRPASRPPRSVPTRGNQEALFASLGTGSCVAADGFAFSGPGEEGLWPCSLPRPLRSRRRARGASRVVFLRRSEAVAPGRRSRRPGRPGPRASRGRFPVWGGALCRPRPRYRRGGPSSVPSFRRPLCIRDLGTRLAGTRIVKKSLFSGHKRYLFGRNLISVEI